MMNRAWVVLTSLCLSAGCAAPSGRRVLSPANEDHAEIARTADGKVRLFSAGSGVVIRVGDAAASIRSLQRVRKLSSILDAPESLAMLHEAFARDADEAHLTAGYEIETEPGRLVVVIDLADGAVTAELSLTGAGPARDAIATVTPSESARLATALRRYLLNLGPGAGPSTRSGSHPAPGR